MKANLSMRLAMLALLSLSWSSKPIWTEFCVGISARNVAKELLFFVGVIRTVAGASCGLDDVFTFNLEEDMVSS